MRCSTSRAKSASTFSKKQMSSCRPKPQATTTLSKNALQTISKIKLTWVVFLYPEKKLLNRTFFDYVILDEAAQSLSVSSWMPILMGKKAIFAGDHKQLPPTVKSKEAEARGFGKTLFEELAERCEASCNQNLTRRPRFDNFTEDAVPHE